MLIIISVLNAQPNEIQMRHTCGRNQNIVRLGSESRCEMQIIKMTKVTGKQLKI